MKSVVKRTNYQLFLQVIPFSLTLPTESVKSERSISAFKRVFNYNRSSMGITRLGNLSLLAIESDILKSIPNTSTDQRCDRVYTKLVDIVYRVSCIVYRVSCIVYRVSCIVYRVSCIHVHTRKYIHEIFSLN